MTFPSIQQVFSELNRKRCPDTIGSCIYKRITSYYRDSFRELEAKLCPIDAEEIDLTDKTSGGFYYLKEVTDFLKKDKNLRPYQDLRLPEYEKSMKHSDEFSQMR